MKLTDVMATENECSVGGDINKVINRTLKITKDMFNTTHEDDTRKSTDIIPNILQNMQRARYTGLANEIRAMRSAPALINLNVLTLDQKDEVIFYFGKAA